MEVIGYENAREQLPTAAVEYFKRKEKALNLPITIIWGNGGVKSRPKSSKGIVIIDWGTPIGPVAPKRKMLYHAKSSYEYRAGRYVVKGYNLKNDWFLAPVGGLQDYSRINMSVYGYRPPEPYENSPTTYCQVGKQTIWILCCLHNFDRQDRLKSLFDAPLNACVISELTEPKPIGRSTKADRRNQLINAVVGTMDKSKESIEKQIERTIKAANDHAAVAAKNYKKADELEQELLHAGSMQKTYRTRATRMLGELDDSVALKDIKFDAASGDLFFFTHLIYLYRRDRKTRVPLGEFKISLNMKTFTVGMCNQTGHMGHYHHPHVPGYSGQLSRPCWGDVYTGIANYIKKGDLAGFFNYAIKFLESYQYDHHCPWYGDTMISKQETKKNIDGETVWMTEKQYRDYQKKKRTVKSTGRARKPGTRAKAKATTSRSATNKRASARTNETRRIRQSSRRVQAK